MDDRFSAIKARVKLINQKSKNAQNSTPYKRVVGTLSGLGFLIAPEVKSLPTSKIDVEEAILVGKNFESRILEVLPAAIYSFPRSFLHVDRAPLVLQEILLAFKTGSVGPDFMGISFEKLREAADRPIKDKRRKSISERRVSKTYRLSPRAVAHLRERSKNCGTNCTDYLEKLILAG